MSTDSTHEAEATLAEAFEGIKLIDHHVHGTLRTTPTRSELEGLLSESDRPVPPWMTVFDSQVGLAIRRWCAPVLDLPPLASAERYVARRSELGETEVTRRLLKASGVDTYLIDTGLTILPILDVEEMAIAATAQAHEIVRLETVFEAAIESGGSAEAVIDSFPNLLAERAKEAVGLKSVIAYRHGFDFDPARPTRHEVVTAARALLVSTSESPARVSDPVLLRHLLWCGVDTGLPIQLHTGFGDPDIELHRCDPLLLTQFIKLVEPTGTDMMLLHCYPYHRQAGFLAESFPHMYFDMGLGVNYTGLRSNSLIAESLELSPFAKILFSSDAWAPAELHFLGAYLWRRGMVKTLAPWVASGELASEDAVRIAQMIGRDNAERVYDLKERV